MGNETKTVISVECIDQTLRMTQAPTIASGGVKENAVEFTFGALWDDLILFAVFYRKPSEVYHVRIEDGRCIVPREVTRNPGCFFLGVMGAKDGVTRTSTVLSYRVEAGAITDGIEPPEPTPSIYAQILASVQSTEQIAQSVRDDADAGKFNGAKGEKGDTGAQGVQGVQGIQGVKGEPGKDGVSPSVEISRSGDTTTIAITDASGVHTAGIKDGSKGDKGDKGDPGAPGKDGSDATVTAQNIEAALGYAPVKDVQVAGTSVMTDGVANVPIANKGGLGVSSVDNYSIGTTDAGALFLYNSRNSDIDARSTNIAVTPYNLDYAVKAAMCDGKGAAWTDAEQKAARDRMGVDKAYELIEEITLTEKVTRLIRNAEPNGTAYHFKKMYVNIVIPQAEENGSIYSTFNNTLIGLAFGCIKSQLSEGGIAQIYANVADGFLDGYGVGGGNQSTSSNLIRYITPSNAPSEITAINSMDILGTVDIPINTNIKIYGVRA